MERSKEWNIRKDWVEFHDCVSDCNKVVWEVELVIVILDEMQRPLAQP